MTKEISISRYIKYGSRTSKINFICPLCLRPMRDITGNSSVILHFRKHHYEHSDLWFSEISEDQPRPNELELLITRIWECEFRIYVIKFIMRLLDNHNILNENYANSDIAIYEHRIKILREKTIKLTS